MKCLNCGRHHDAEKLICDTCAASFPGAPTLLTGMLDAVSDARVETMLATAILARDVKPAPSVSDLRTSRWTPVIARLTGRCANGAERDGGRQTHIVIVRPPLTTASWQKALCGAAPGRLSNGWDAVEGAATPTCPRCAKKAARL